MIFKYKGYGGCACKCDILVFGNTVIATELEDNMGTSITNMAEHVAKDVCDARKIPYDKLIWVEHYPERDGIKETYDLVTFNITADGFANPRWKPLEEVEIRNLIGGSNA
jgi:hypothetical protein